MRAAVVTSFGRPPACQDFPEPTPTKSTEFLVDVLAAGLYPRVRAQAKGSHYTSSEELPLVPGIDGVGRGPDGTLRYFLLPDTTMGAMAERTVIDLRRSVVLPEDTDPIRVAAAMNPAMSSWLALRQRITIEPGQCVLILGATGNAGQLAVPIAKHLGAGQVIGAGREPGRLAVLRDLGAEATVSLAGDVDVVLDYLWGRRPPTRSPPWSRTAPTPARRSAGSRSVRSPGPPRPSRRLPYAPPAFRSSEADRARSPLRTSWPSCPLSLPPSPPEPCGSTRGPSR
jgi:hypothetical protein